MKSESQFEDKNILLKKLLESEEKYRNLVELSPDAIIVHCEGQIVFANLAAARLLGEDIIEILYGRNIMDFIHPEFKNKANERIRQVKTKGKLTNTASYKLIDKKGKIIDVEVASASINYLGKTAVQVIMRDLTERKKELKRAAQIQINRLNTSFPLIQKADLEVIYKPYNIISGDLFHFHKLDEENVMGFLGDVTGKGIVAALSNSAVKVLFYEVTSSVKEPMEVLRILNKEIKKYLEDEYVAASCFKFDFKKMEFTIAAAGINLFSFNYNGIYCFEEIVKGPSLGMLDNALFEEKKIKFTSEDCFYLYTDGFEKVFEDEKILNSFKSIPTLKLQKQLLEHALTNGFLEDDATLLAIKIK